MYFAKKLLFDTNAVYYPALARHSWLTLLIEFEGLRVSSFKVALMVSFTIQRSSCPIDHQAL